MNYEGMSDFDINKRVAELMGARVPKDYESNPYLHVNGNSIQQLNMDGTKIEGVLVPDYCNNPSDAWPIILENGISLNKWNPYDPYWSADVEHPQPTSTYNTIEIENENPLRAAMICLLKMKEKQK